MHRYCFFILVAIAAVLTGCSNSSAPSQQQQQSEFWPLTRGSNWTYTGISSYTLTVVGDSTIDGKVYTKASRSTGGYDLFFVNGEGMLSVRESDGSEVPIIPREVPLGKTWTYKRTVHGTVVTYQHTVAGVQSTRTVHDTTYTGVLQIDVYEIEEAHGNEHGEHSEPKKKFVMSRYYARSVGLIESNSGVWGSVYLTNYHIQ